MCDKPLVRHQRPFLPLIPENNFVGTRRRQVPDKEPMHHATRFKATPPVEHHVGQIQPQFFETLSLNAGLRGFNAFAAAADCDVFLSVGTSSLVYPAAGLARLAAESGATVIEINPNPTEMSSRFHYAIAENAGSALPELVDSVGV